MRNRIITTFAALLICGSAFGQVLTQAFVPETGFYWNPDEPGRGYGIEIQDRVVFITVYTYTEEGNVDIREALWFTTSGVLTSSSIGGVTYTLDSDLFLSEDGQCLGCDFPGQPLTTNTGRPVTLTFDSVSTAELNINGEIIPLIRFWYTPSIQDAIFAMLGQWIVVTDCTAPSANNCFPSDPNVQPFEADLLDISFEDTGGGVRTASGVRGGTNIEVAGAFDAVNNSFIIVVAETDAEFLAYVIDGADFGTDQFRATAERFSPGGQLVGDGFPAYGRRISDRTFAATLVPAKSAEATANEVVTPRQAATAKAETAPPRPVSKEAKLAAMNRIVRQLEQKLSSEIEQR